MEESHHSTFLTPVLLIRAIEPFFFLKKQTQMVIDTRSSWGLWSRTTIWNDCIPMDGMLLFWNFCWTYQRCWWKIVSLESYVRLKPGLRKFSGVIGWQWWAWLGILGNKSECLLHLMEKTRVLDDITLDKPLPVHRSWIKRTWFAEKHWQMNLPKYCGMKRAGGKLDNIWLRAHIQL